MSERISGEWVCSAYRFSGEAGRHEAALPVICTQSKAGHRFKVLFKELYPGQTEEMSAGSSAGFSRNRKAQSNFIGKEY